MHRNVGDNHWAAASKGLQRWNTKPFPLRRIYQCGAILIQADQLIKRDIIIELHRIGQSQLCNQAVELSAIPSRAASYNETVVRRPRCMVLKHLCDILVTIASPHHQQEIGRRWEVPWSKGLRVDAVGDNMNSVRRVAVRFSNISLRRLRDCEDRTTPLQQTRHVELEVKVLKRMLPGETQANHIVKRNNLTVLIA